jgi:hypothetical protein
MNDLSWSCASVTGAMERLRTVAAEVANTNSSAVGTSFASTA